MGRSVIVATVVAAAAAGFLLPAPAGVDASTMHAAAVVLLTIGLWAAGALPEHVTGFIFFTLVMVFAIAPAQVVFSGFSSATMWLVFGGLILAQGVIHTGLAHCFAGVLFDRFTVSYVRLVAAIVAIAVVLAFFMPATVGRVLLLVPILSALAERLGFARGSSGYNGICLAAIMTTYQCGTAILPSNAPNLVLAGTAETLYGAHINYAEYLWVQFPVMGILKGAAIVAFVCWLFPAQVRPAASHAAALALTAEQRRMILILAAALLLWATDFLHGISAGWIALAAGTACLLPRVGVMPVSAFHEIRLGPYFYIGATLGLGALIQKTGLSDLLGRNVFALLPLRPGADFPNFIALSLFATVAGIFTTNPAQPAVLGPLAGHFAQAAGWPLHAALMTTAAGFSTMILPHQVPPVVVGMHVARVDLAAMLRLSAPLALFSIVVLLPLDYLWWRAIGYFG